MLQLNNVSTVQSSYHEHSCALINDGTVKCWGSNGFGKLGNGTDDWNAKEPIEVIGL